MREAAVSRSYTYLATDRKRSIIGFYDEGLGWIFIKLPCFLWPLSDTSKRTTQSRPNVFSWETLKVTSVCDWSLMLNVFSWMVKCSCHFRDAWSTSNVHLSQQTASFVTLVLTFYSYVYLIKKLFKNIFGRMQTCFVWSACCFILHFEC